MITQQIRRSLYANEKLGAALAVLATHPGEIHQRVRWAVQELQIVPPQFFPPDIADEVIRLREARDKWLRRKRRLATREAQEAAQTIMRLYFEMRSRLEGASDDSQ